MKTYRKLISILLVCVLALFGASCAPEIQLPTQPTPEITETPASSASESDRQELQLLKLDDCTVPEDIKLSRLKAEYLLQNNGYKPDDEVIAILSIDDTALIDAYLTDDKGADSVATFSATETGRNLLSTMAEKQSALIGKLFDEGLITSVEHVYSTVLNAVAVKTSYKNFLKLDAGYAGVSKATLSDTYARPQAVDSDAVAAIENDVNVYETGIFDSSSVNEYVTGEGTAVAILDSGFDCSHEVYNTHALDEDKLLLDRETIARLLPETKAVTPTIEAQTNHTVDPDDIPYTDKGYNSTGKEIKLEDVWYSSKIPFKYDYADKDPDVFPHDSEHGTHVGGIIGGYADSYNDKDGNVVTDANGEPIPFKGVAPDTQLVLLKVFPDLQQGAQTDDILAALEDAVLLGVDCINMSLGAACGFAREEDGDSINEVYDKVNASGVSLLTAAGNEYSSGFGGEQGNTNFVTNPDSGTVGSPSTYAPSLSVASIDGKKANFMIGNDSQIVFFNESNSVTGEANDFFAELFSDVADKGAKFAFGADDKPDRYDGIALDANGDLLLEYVTVPGTGARQNYTGGINVKGKIALVRRGDNTFEDKALQAKNAGAIGCIIYNNIDGDILMSMGKTAHLPTISISKDDGTILAAQETGTLLISRDNQAGPFMSDFSSWGPTGDLQLKPEITAHGGNILSSVPGTSNGKYNYNELSGTSMATPNLCGAVVLIRQFLKERYENLSWKQISVLTNQMLMSTATILLDKQGNPYAPRKQGAGLASIYNVVNTDGYLTVDGIDRTKIELKDDPEKKGVYEMPFNVVNVTDHPISYKLSVVGMTESVSTSDPEHVAEKGQLLTGTHTVDVAGGEGDVSGDTVTVEANGTLKLKVTYRLAQADKDLIDDLFPYGMYVEGFVKLQSTAADGIDINIPFLGYYGDWTRAPIFDKTYYEVESEAHDLGIDDEDKLKADYYATTPLGTLYYDYIIPLGSYLYDIDTSRYDYIVATPEHAAMSDFFGSITGISAIYAGLLRNAKTMYYTITDKATGDVVWEKEVTNARKAYSQGGSPIPSYEQVDFSAYQAGLINNRRYTFEMRAKLDYERDGTDENVRNTFAFDFTMDDEAPVIKSCVYEKEYDRTARKNRYYMTMTLWDNHYVMAINPVVMTLGVTDEGRQAITDISYLLDNPIPLYGDRGEDASVRFEITDLLEELEYNNFSTASIGFIVDDYALNQGIYVCHLPGTKGPFSFTSDGDYYGRPLQRIELHTDEIIDLTQYLGTADTTVDADKEYLKHLTWESDNERIATVREGQVLGVSAGRATITVSEPVYGESDTIVVDVIDAAASASAEAIDAISATPYTQNDVPDIGLGTLENIRFSYFDTVYAYARGAQTTMIGSTGDRTYTTAIGNRISFYPGEKIRLAYDIDPWYIADSCELTWRSSNPTVATVDETGLVTGVAKGSAIITLSVAGSNQMARLSITINDPFVIENRELVAFKGLPDADGTVTIPDDEGILYIASFAFCLYTTDVTMDIPDDDFDANKTPLNNETIKKVIVPEGVQYVERYAFYNCIGLEEVVLPKTIKFIRDHAFTGDEKLAKINLTDVEAIGESAFEGCTALDNIDLDQAYAIGIGAFRGCTSLKTIDLSHLRNAGAEVFSGCTALASVTLTADTKLSEEMFRASGVESVTIYEKNVIPVGLFRDCPALTSVTIENDVLEVGAAAFAGCDLLQTVTFKGAVGSIGTSAFEQCTGLQTITLPNSGFSLGNSVFAGCTALKTVVFQANTVVTDALSCAFGDTVVDTFEVKGNAKYTVSEDKQLLLTDGGKTVVFAAPAAVNGTYSIPETVTKIGPGAFSGCKIESLTIPAGVTEIGSYAFGDCELLSTVTFPTSAFTIGERAFDGCTLLETVENLDKASKIGDYAFCRTAVGSVSVGDGAAVGEGAFFRSGLTTLHIGKNATLGTGAFQNCTQLTAVTVDAAGGVTLGDSCFTYDSALTTFDLTTFTEIPSQCFYACQRLQRADLTKCKKIGDYAFATCSALAVVTCPVVETIGDGAFGTTFYLTQDGQIAQNGLAPAFSSIDLPSTLTEIGDSAFVACPFLESIEIPASVTKLGESAFESCSSLLRVTLHENITALPVAVFAGCSNLMTIDLSHIETVGDYAFTSCAALRPVQLSAVTVIGYGAFAGCSAMAGEIVAPNLVEVGPYAFQQSGITGLKAENLEVIGPVAFNACTALRSFAFGAGIRSVGEIAFLDATSLREFTMIDGSADGKINDTFELHDGVLYDRLNGKLRLLSVPSGWNKNPTLTVVDGTYRIEAYAGGANRNFTMLVLPDSLAYIGAYAFYDCAGLRTVEFRSVTAPVLENVWDSELGLSSSAPGYGALYSQYDLMGNVICYCNFVDLVGARVPLAMILPSNTDLSGYDALPYAVYFGGTAAASRSQYVAMEQAMKDFLELAPKVIALEKITMASETLISDAVARLNAVKQDPTQFGYTAEQWNEMVSKVNAANDALARLRVANAPKAVRDVQALIDALPTAYDGSAAALRQFEQCRDAIASLTVEQRSLLIMARYNEFAATYDPNATPPSSGSNQKGCKKGCGSALGGAVIGFAALAFAALLLLKKKQPFSGR